MAKSKSPTREEPVTDAGNATSMLVELMDKLVPSKRPGTCLFAIGKVEARRKFQGKTKDGKEYLKKVFDLRQADGSLLEVTDWNDLICPNVGDYVLIPVRTPGQVTVFNRGGGEEF